MEYKKFNDYELHYLIRENNEEAFNLMIEKYQPLIESLASQYYYKFNNVPLDLEDLKQEGQIALINAIESFEDSKNVLFFTYARVFIKRAVERHVREVNRYKHQILSSASSLDYELSDSGFSLENFLYETKDITEDELIDRERCEKIINFKYSLKDRHAQVFELRINNFSNKEIAELLNINYKAVDNSLRLIKEKFSNYYFK